MDLQIDRMEEFEVLIISQSPLTGLNAMMRKSASRICCDYLVAHLDLGRISESDVRSLWMHKEKAMKIGPLNLFYVFFFFFSFYFSL